MSVTHLTDADSYAAQRLWRHYIAQHDVTDLNGQTAGIDPASGRIWFGKSIQDIVHQMDAEQVATGLFFVRVGSDAYWQKGGHF